MSVSRLVAAATIGRLLCAVPVLAQDPAGAGVIAKLTAASREEAVRCGHLGAGCAVAPYELCHDTLGYAATLVTPFSRVASAVLDAETSGRPLGRMGPASVNRWGVSIHVSPDPRSSNPDAIRDLEIHREGHTLHPLKATVGPITVTRPDGSPHASSRAVFTIPADALSPTPSSIEIVFVGASRQTCTVEPAQLEKLR